MISAKCDPERSWVQGRNGIAKVAELRIWGDEKAYIDFVNRRGMAINGGGAVNVEAMDSLARQWLEERGWICMSPEEIAVQNSVEKEV